MERNNVKSNFASLWVLFLIYPFGSLIYAIKNFNIKKYRIFLVLFGVFYGLCYIALEGSDASTYSDIINELRAYPFSVYWHDVMNMYNADVRFNDAYIPTVFYIVSKFSYDPLAYRIVFATIYFIVLIALVGNIYDFVHKKSVSRYYIWFLLGVVFLINLSAGINGVRFPLALQLFLLGFFKYSTLNKPKYLVICVSAFLVHFMIGYLLFFLIVYVTTKRFYNSVYGVLLILIFFVTSLSLGSVVGDSTGVLGEGIEQRADSYSTNEDYKEERNNHLEKVNWYIKYNRYSTYYYGLFCLLMLIVYKKKLRKDNIAMNFEYFAVLMFIASFISAQLVDELSNRYYLFANGALLIYMVYLSSINHGKIIRRLTYLYIPICIMHILIMMRGDQETLSYNLFIGNVFTELL